LEPAFFAYFLCGGKESKCRPAQGQRQQTEKKARKGQNPKNNNQKRAAAGKPTVSQTNKKNLTPDNFAVANSPHLPR
jgi:hypothetical protein